MKTRALLVCALLLVAFPATAGSFANGVSLYTDRVRRSVSQTDGPGLAAEVKYNADDGWFAGLWAGTVNYDNVTGETFELLPFFAYTHRIGSGSAEIGLLHHAYPGANRGISYDEAEITLRHKVGRGSVSAGAYFRLRNQEGGHSWYWLSEGRFPIGSLQKAKLALSLHAGVYRDPADSQSNFADGSIALFATQGRAIVGVSLSDSSLSRRSAMPGAPDAGMRLSISFTRMFRRSH